MSSDNHGIWPWNVLGLPDKGATEREVRKAYAKRLKAMDPEKDPRGFEDLRRAYERARNVAKLKAPRNEPKEEPPLEWPAEDEKAPIAAPMDEVPEAATEPQEDATDPPGPATNETPPVSRDSGEDWIDTAQQDAPEPNGEKIESLADLIAQMDEAVAERNYDMDFWQRLLSRPALDDFTAAAEFERALVGALEKYELPKDKPFKVMLDAPGPWLELIETRYGWFSDGLRFNKTFYGQMRLHSAFTKSLKAHRPSEMAPRKSSPAVGHSSRQFERDLPGWAFGVWPVLITLICLISYVNYFEGTAWVLPTFLLWAFSLITMIKYRFPQSSDKLPEWLTSKLVGFRATSILFASAAWIWAAALVGAVVEWKSEDNILPVDTVIAAVREQPNYFTRTLRLNAVSESRFVRSSATNRFGVHRAEGVLRENLDASDDAIVSALGIPAPILHLREDRGRTDLVQFSDGDKVAFPPETGSVLYCQADENCRLRMVSSLVLDVEVRQISASPTEHRLIWRTVVDKPTIEWTMNLHNDTPPELDLLGQSSFTASPVDRSTLYGPSLQLAVASLKETPNGYPELHLIPTTLEGIERLALNNCVIDDLEKEWQQVISLHPNPDELRQAMCTLPVEAIELTVSGCSNADGGSVSCPYSPSLNAGATFLKETTNRTFIRMDRDRLSERPTLPLTQAFDTPSDQVLIAAMRSLKGLPPLPISEEAEALRRQLAGQIISDYLTILQPESLREGLQQSIAQLDLSPIQDATKQELAEAVAAQPHLYPLLGPIRSSEYHNELSAAILRNAVGFLKEAGMM